MFSILLQISTVEFTQIRFIPSVIADINQGERMSEICLALRTPQTMLNINFILEEKS